MVYIHPIKTRKDALTKVSGSPSRAKVVREIRKPGYSGWRDKYKYGDRDKYKYGDRWMVESFLSGVKIVFGRHVELKL